MNHQAQSVRQDAILVVPTLNRYDGLLRLVQSVEQGSVLPREYLVIDNGGSLIDFLRAENKPLPRGRTRIVVPGKNMGVAASWNLGLERGEELTILAADDCTVEANTLIELFNMADSMPNEGFFSPMTQNPNHSEWSFFMQRKSLVDHVGLYDEVFWPGYFEDDDYRRRMLLSGFVPCRPKAARIKHIGGATSTQFDRKTLFQSNLDRYVAKWGGQVGRERVSRPANPIVREKMADAKMVLV